MKKHHPENERAKRRYLVFLREAKRQDEASVDAVAKAISRFEQYTKWRDFKTFHFEQAVGFKANLAKSRNQRTGKALSKATMNSTLRALKAFFQWLAMQRGYKSRLNYTDMEYFNLSQKDGVKKKGTSQATTGIESPRDATQKEEATRFRNESSLLTTPGIQTGRTIRGKKKIAHFLGFLQHAIAAHHCPSMWRLPGDRANLPLSRPDYWQVAAQVMERGLFDAMFIADVLAPYDTYEGNSDATVKWGV